MILTTFFGVTIWHKYHILDNTYDTINTPLEGKIKRGRHSVDLFLFFLVAGPRIARGPQGYAYHFGFRRTNIGFVVWTIPSSADT